MIAEFVGGPLDGTVQEVPDSLGPMLVAAVMTHAPAFLPASTDEVPTICTREVAYLRDLALTWRFIYQGERAHGTR